MADSTTKNSTPKISSQENKENSSSTANEFGDFEDKSSKTAESNANQESTQKTVKLKRKKAPDVLLVKPEKQKVLEKRIKIDCNESKIPPIKSQEANKLEENKIITSKPPLPPLSTRKVLKPQTNNVKLKRKFEDESLQQIQKLSAANEQLRLEITELKILLQNEKIVSRRLRAQNDGEYRKAKNESKKLNEIINHQKKSSNNFPNPNYFGVNAKRIPVENHADIAKLNAEIQSLKDSNKLLEEKFMNASDAEKKLTTTIREIKESYESRLAQVSKSAKTEINRLLGELKTKDRSLSLLKKEINSHKKLQNKRDGSSGTGAKPSSNGTLVSSQMRKNKIIEEENQKQDVEVPVSSIIESRDSINHETPSQQSLSLSNVNPIITTCDKENSSWSHELENSKPSECTMKALGSSSNSFNECKNHNTDNDSALSSAPQSLSPQPSMCSYSENTLFTDEKSKELDFLQKKYVSLKQQLLESRNQICELENMITRETNNKSEELEKLLDKMKHMECREKSLEKETHELREQNELLEFRILELEESHDKWSLRSNSTPDTKDVWTDTEKESDDLLILSDRSDSGITSPHHHLDDHQSVSPCSLSLIDQIPTDDVRKRILLMTKKCYDEEDKLCLMQIISLLNNLEALSQDQSINGDDISIDLNMEKYRAQQESPDVHIFRSSTFGTNSRPHGKIVATVQPYTTTNSCQEPKKAIPQTPGTQSSLNKSACWISTSLGESGVFEDSNLPMLDYCSRETQTETSASAAQNKSNAELCAEIEKLNRFREKIEESTKAKNKQEFVNLLSSDAQERHLKFYQERLNFLENKIAVYESSGDLQIKLLAERLQREIQLESWNGQLQEKIEKLESEHLDLEEANCELEEIENDTRLRLQRLEVEYEVMQQRNMELEVSKNSYQEKYQDAKQNIDYMQESLQKSEEKIFLLEEHETELRHKLELTQAFLPAVVLYQAWQFYQVQNENTVQKNKVESMEFGDFEETNKLPDSDEVTVKCIGFENDGDIKTHHIIRIGESDSKNSVKVPDIIELHPDHPIQRRMHELMMREKELTQNIVDLNRAYNETLENADNLWAQMEKEYKDKIGQCEVAEANLRSKIQQLEKRLLKDTEYAQERIASLEETELNLKQRLCKLNRESKEHQQKYNEILDELNSLRDEHQKLQAYLNGPASENLEKERRKVRKLEEELAIARKMLADIEEIHRSEQQLLKKQLQRINKELTHCEVTNSELREEVDTLESRITELESFRKCDVDKIKLLTDELESKHHQLVKHQQFGVLKTSKSLAQELEKPMIRQRTVIPTTSDVNAARSMISNAINNFERAPNANGFGETRYVAKEVKSLADSIISNAEARGGNFPPIKKSFVEEARSRFAKWV